LDEKLAEVSTVMKNKIFILLDEHFPVDLNQKNLLMKNTFHLLKNIEGENFENFRDEIVNHPNPLLFDLTLGPLSRKERIIKSFRQGHISIVSDLATVWGEYLVEKYPNLIGGHTLSFYSPTEKVEFYSTNHLANMAQVNFFEELDLSPVEVKSPRIGFTYPRTISTLINEAYYSLEDGLASKEDLDNAMKFGTNYPLGPIEWSERIGSLPVYLLLQQLYEATGNQRYSPALSLKKLALQKL
jgi:3-hydroxybutyryl-CoA dehydrogenase